MIPMAIASIVEHVGGILPIGSVAGKDYTENPGMHRTLFGDGLAVNVGGGLGVNIGSFSLQGISLCGSLAVLLNLLLPAESVESNEVH